MAVDREQGCIMGGPVPLNPNPIPNVQLMNAVLGATLTPNGLNFLREIAYRSPEWVRSDEIESRLGLNSRQVGGIHKNVRDVVERVSHPNQPSPWARIPGESGVFAWYLMTTEVAGIVLAHPAPPGALPPP